VYNYRQEGKLSPYFRFLENNLKKDGDLVEAGVFRGYSLLSVALFLKEKQSEKKIYAYDSFAGFPPVEDKNDSIEKFKDLYDSGNITKEHYMQVQSLIEIRKNFKENKMYALSTSNKFENTSRELLEEKIGYLGLDNIILIEGSFNETMNDHNPIRPDNILSGIIDSDLYNSYKVALKFFWPRLIKGGCLYLDEYFSLKFPGARIAIDEFLLDYDGSLIKYHDNPLDFERWFLKK